MINILNQISSQEFQLQNSRIDIWQFPLHSEFTEASALLNKEERARAKRYHFKRHQRRFTVARAMMRLILARYLTSSAAELEFTYNPQGKPALLTAHSLQFNLSHSGDLALLAVGQDFSVGIDLEFFSARPYEGIGKHLFSPRENNVLHHAPLRMKPLLFFHIWAQKEAFIKASGLGLSYPTQAFDVPIFAKQSIIDTLNQTSWESLAFMPQIACCAALCHHLGVTDIRTFKLDKNWTMLPRSTLL